MNRFEVLRSLVSILGMFLTIIALWLRHIALKSLSLITLSHSSLNSYMQTPLFDRGMSRVRPSTA